MGARLWASDCVDEGNSDGISVVDGDGDDGRNDIDDGCDDGSSVARENNAAKLGTEDGAKKDEGIGGAVNICVGIADDDVINVSGSDDDAEGDKVADGAIVDIDDGEEMILGVDDIEYWGIDAIGDDVAPFGDRVAFGRPIKAEGAPLIIIVTGGSTTLNGAMVGSGVGSGVVSAGGIGFSGSGGGPGPGPGFGSGFGRRNLPLARTFEVENKAPSLSTRKLPVFINCG